MKARELAEMLLKTPEEEVMFTDPNSGGGPFAVMSANVRITKKNEFPKSWHMPEGFKFIELLN